MLMPCNVISFVKFWSLSNCCVQTDIHLSLNGAAMIHHEFVVTSGH